MLPIELSEFLADVNEAGGQKTQSLLAELACEGCGARALALTGSRVARQAIALDGTDSVAVPLSKCGACASRRRVLPVDLLPYKTFSLPVIAHFAQAYLTSTHTLRSTVGKDGTPATKPHFTTLHGWLGGLGERALDQVKLRADRAVAGGKPALPPFSALLEEAERRTGAPMVCAFLKP